MAPGLSRTTETTAPPDQAVASGEADLAARARAWVEESCAAQGIPVKITDPTTIRHVAEILREGRAEPLRRA
jgi:hypothetical protein